MDGLRDDIRAAINANTHNSMPSFCEEVGIVYPPELGGTKAEKATALAAAINDKDLADIALRVARVRNSIPLEEKVIHLLERDAPKIHRINRRDIARCFDEAGGLAGDADILEIVQRRWPLSTLEDEFTALLGKDTTSLRYQITRHMVLNDDWSTDMLFDKIGAYTWTHARFVKLIEGGIHPIARRDEAQTKLVAALNPLLAKDGFRLDIVGHESNYPVYHVVPNSSGVKGSAKNLIFASDGCKPIIGLADAINNDLKVLEFEKTCLVYDRNISPNGLLWTEMVDGWHAQNKEVPADKAAKVLGERLKKSLQSDGERQVLAQYFHHFRTRLGASLPALIPQVYLHYDPISAKDRGERASFLYQRMDFLLLLPNRIRVVLEIDGKHHFCDGDTPSLAKYAEMVAADRDLKLRGYEVYRFGANEVVGPQSAALIGAFFERLFEKHQVI